LLVIGPLRDCSGVEDFSGLEACEAENDKRMVDGQVLEAAPAALGRWIPHPGPAMDGWSLSPTAFGSFAFDLGRMKEDELFSDVLDQVVPELTALRARSFFKALDGLSSRVAAGTLGAPSQATSRALLSRIPGLQASVSGLEDVFLSSASIAFLSGEREGDAVDAAREEFSPDLPGGGALGPSVQRPPSTGEEARASGMKGSWRGLKSGLGFLFQLSILGGLAALAGLGAGGAYVFRKRPSPCLKPSPTLERPSRQEKSPPPLARGPLIGGRFRLGDLVGRGTSGTVFRGLDVGLGRPVAVRRLDSRLGGAPEIRTALLGAARAAAQLRSFHIAASVAAIEEKSGFYLVSESCDGISLERMLSSSRRLGVRRTFSVLRDVCAAIGHAHSRGAVHGDLYPGHVFVAASGIVKVKDFLVADRAKRSLLELSPQDGWNAGAYRSPEQVEGEPSSPRSDMFSLGVLAFRMLSGELPFQDEDSLTAKKTGGFPAASEIAPGLPPGLDAVLGRALHPDPGERHSSPAALFVSLCALPFETEARPTR